MSTKWTINSHSTVLIAATCSFLLRCMLSYGVGNSVYGTHLRGGYAVHRSINQALTKLPITAQTRSRQNHVLPLALKFCLLLPSQALCLHISNILCLHVIVDNNHVCTLIIHFANTHIHRHLSVHCCLDPSMVNDVRKRLSWGPQSTIYVHCMQYKTESTSIHLHLYRLSCPLWLDPGNKAVSELFISVGGTGAEIQGGR